MGIASCGGTQAGIVETVEGAGGTQAGRTVLVEMVGQLVEVVVRLAEAAPDAVAADGEHLDASGVRRVADGVDGRGVTGPRRWLTAAVK
ncbi:hypothetical protein [Streptomyces chartreusis]|uniref:hypothetical protein n=1 Tax=Streptomyces chartreusis TaxID=1969 RepID=UPI002E18F6A7